MASSNSSTPEKGPSTRLEQQSTTAHIEDQPHDQKALKANANALNMPEGKASYSKKNAGGGK